MNVLVVCPDDGRTGELKQALEGARHRVFVVGTPAEGLAAAEKAQPSAIVFATEAEGTCVADFRSALETRVPDRAVPVLPASPGDAPASVVEALGRLTGTEADEAPPGKTLLLVDEKAANRRRLVSQLSGDGWNILEAVDARSAALLLIDNAIDCMVVTAMLSGQTSHGLVRSAQLIRKVHPNPFTILVLADAENSASAARMIDSGADDVVSRTGGAALLLRRLRSLANFRDLLRENRRLQERIASLEAAHS